MKKLIALFIPVLLMISGCTTVEKTGEHIIYPEGLDCIVDVTKPPYNADKTGQTDCTEAIIRAIDDIVKPDLEAIKETIEIVNGDRKDVYRASEISFEERQRILSENPKAVIGFERCAATFPYQNPPAKILYFPTGTYLVSKTLRYSFKNLQNRAGKEFNRCLHFQGQSEEGTIIRLADNSKGFEEGTGKAVISFTTGNPSNVSMQNTCENMTIEIGAGNPGAVGLEFFANNTGAVRNLTVRSADPEKKGRSGVAITTHNSSCVLLKHITITGCDYGIEISQNRLYTAAEHIVLKDQRIAGFLLQDNNVAVRGLVSDNSVPALMIGDEQATIALIDCKLTGRDEKVPAIDLRGGFLWARNIETSGYIAALHSHGKNVAEDPYISEYISRPFPFSDPPVTQHSLNLPVEETPEIPWENDLTKWISVNELGAAGDGLSDDTEAIQKAMLSGKPVVYFKPGIYLIDKPIEVPPTVERVNFMYSDLVAGENLQNSENAGTFIVNGESEKPLILEDLFAFERYFGAHYLVDHASHRTVVLSDLHTQVGAMYRNSVEGGKVFIENVCTTDQFPPYKNCFTFKGQQVWARQLNPERSNPEVHNDGGRLWVLGFKTEKSGTAYLTTGGGETEILGGIFNISRAANSFPAIVTRDAKASVFASTTDHQVRPEEYGRRPFIEESTGSDTTRITWDMLPKRDEHLVAVPVYSNK